MYLFLILIGAILIIVSVKRDKKKQKEQASFTTLFHKEETEVKDIDIAVGQLRMEFSSTILELQKEIVKLSEKIDAVNNEQLLSINVTQDKSNEKEQFKEKAPEKGTEKKESVKKPAVNPKNESQTKEEISVMDETQSNETNNVNKISEIGELLAKGFSIDDICEKFQMGRGEILLIKELYLK
jgi:hypothetical protein